MITSNNQSISDILRSIDEGKIQLTDFKRCWIWKDNIIRSINRECHRETSQWPRRKNTGAYIL